MKKILLCTVPFARDPAWYLPLGLLSIGTVLRKARKDVDVLDINAERLTKEEVRDFFIKNQYEVVGISALTTLYNYTLWLAETIKEVSPDTKIVLGGNLFSSHPRFVLENIPADIGVYGEGEETILELLDAVEKKLPLSRVKGIWYRENGQILSSEPRALIQDLDRLYPLDYGLIPLNKYLLPGSLTFTRGCTNRCSYCVQLYKGVRKRSVRGLIAEVSLLKKKYGIKSFTFLDSYLLSDKNNLDEFCGLLKKEGVNWSCSERLDQVDQTAMRKMKEAGCVGVNFGVESYNQDLLNAMNKRVTIEQIDRGLEIAEKIKFKQLSGSYIVGFFQETEETIKRNIEFAKKHRMASFCFYLTPFPGTPVYNEAIKRGYITDEKKYFQEHLGRGDEFSSISNRFYLNMTALSDRQLIDGYSRFESELQTKGSLLFRIKDFVKLQRHFLDRFRKR